MPFAPVLTGGPIVDAAWRRLLDLAPPRPRPPLTQDPDLHVLADVQRLDAARKHGDAWTFRLAALPGALRIVSRAAAPDVLGTARDPRELGVAVRRIEAARGTRGLWVDAGDERLTDGFHAYEADNGYRWTDGDAGLPVSLFAGLGGPFDLVLHIGETASYREAGRVRLAG